MNSLDLILDNERKLVKITAVGEFFQSDGEKLITLARTEAAEHGYNVLYDIRQATASVPFASWFELPGKLEVFKDPKKRQVRAAILASQNDKAVHEYEFYELVTDNLGINIRIFFKESEALEWLGKKASITNKIEVNAEILSSGSK
ncbi:hypothetical protein BH10ACI1_BH10ACI1_19140 [soil metagenome]